MSDLLWTKSDKLPKVKILSSNPVLYNLSASPGEPSDPAAAAREAGACPGAGGASVSADAHHAQVPPAHRAPAPCQQGGCQHRTAPSQVQGQYRSQLVTQEL